MRELLDEINVGFIVREGGKLDYDRCNAGLSEEEVTAVKLRPDGLILGCIRYKKRLDVIRIDENLNRTILNVIYKR